jgi:hypothetical protein
MPLSTAPSTPGTLLEHLAGGLDTPGVQGLEAGGV